MQNIMERLRPLVGLKSWDYCVVWKLSEDQRFIEWGDCCCAGADNSQYGGEELFPVSQLIPCRDVMFPHPKTKSCDLLAQLLSPIPLDSGIHAEALFSNQQYRWLNFSSSTDSGSMKETIWTTVFIPVTGGLIELFVANQVADDQNVIDFITAQCSISMEQEAAMINSSNMDTNFEKNPNNHHFQQPPISPTTALENLNLPYDISVDRIRLCNSPINFSEQQFNFTSENRTRNNFFMNGYEEMEASQNSMDASNMMHHLDIMEPFSNNNDQQEGNDKDSVKQETGRSDSVSDCSDQIDDEDDAKYPRRNGKGPQSKNLVAERKRRKKLNDRLYALRALVPKISKLDRASILGDAIEFVKELQKQAKDLQDELEEHSDDKGVKNSGITGGSPSNVQSEILNKQNGYNFHLGESGNGSINPSKQNHDSDSTNDKAQQMEPQVEVSQIDGNEFYVKVFCEHKPGGFARLLEALNSLGLEVTNANVTSFRSLVSNVFKVEKKDSEMVQADHVRDSLLELTKHPIGIGGQWPEIWKISENGSGMEYHHHHQHNHHNGSYHHLHN